MRSAQVGPEGAVALGAALRVNRTLTWLDAGDNCITNEGAVAFAEALKENDALISLNLWLNHIDAEGLLALAEAMSENRTLATLNISRNPLPSSRPGALQLLQTACRGHCVLETECTKYPPPPLGA